MYGPTGTAPRSVIRGSNQNQGVQTIAFDAVGNIYIGGGTLVEEFAAKAPHALLRTITGFTEVFAEAIDASGNLYVVDRGYPLLADTYVPSSVSVVLPGATTASRVLLGGVGPLYISVAVGPDGSVYVGQMGGDITVFSPGATKPSRTLLATAGAQSLVFDTLGNIYAYCFTEDLIKGTFPSKIVVYGPGAKVPTRTITVGIGVPGSPQSLAIDAQNHLFVTNGNPFITTSPPNPTSSNTRR